MKEKGKETPMSAEQIAIASGQMPASAFSSFNGRVNYQLNPSAAGTAPNSFFGPLQPIVPVAQEAAWGRQFDYSTGINTRVTPRLEEALSFDQLKRIADSYDVLRTIIERRKDLIVTQNWTIGPKDRNKKRDPRCDEMEAFFASPDKFHNWDEWLRMLLEQLFVLDAVTIATTLNKGGGTYALELIDGGTIRRVITENGRTPLPPDPAYQQILKGLPAVNYTTDQLTYKPRNLRVHKLYGYSPVEQIVTTVNIALHRQLYQLNYYTEGSTPDLIFQVPETWNPDQIAQFRNYWLSMLQGNLENRRGAMFVPAGVAPYNTKEVALKDEYDEWLTRICCFAFSISPTPFIKATNRATADSQREAALSEGLGTDLKYIASLIEFLMIKNFGYSDLTLRWVEDESIDPLIRAQTFDLYLKNKVYHPDEVRQKLGDDPMDPKLREELSTISTPDSMPQGQDNSGETGNSAAVGKPLKQDAKQKSSQLTKIGPLY